jgi:SAM-dependent methyltransferase
MTITRPMASSNDMANRPAPDLGYPMPSYIAAWKTYRTLSNEDDVIAKRLALTTKAAGTGNRILDVGPGDGRVLLRTLIRMSQRPTEVCVIEPNPEFIEETLRSVSFDRFFDRIVPRCCKLSDCKSDSLVGYDHVFCTHTAYFLTDEEMDMLLKLVSAGARLCVVLDHPDSIFSRLWRRTASEYYQRARRHSERLLGLDRSEFIVNVGEIEAEVSNPFDLRDDIRDLVMSMLCYADVDDMPHEELASVEAVVRGALVGSAISCKSYFFEITKS